jgi:menaquinone-dependent protoporphyrinogen IX oxidase
MRDLFEICGKRSNESKKVHDGKIKESASHKDILMQKALIIFESRYGSTEEVAKILALVLGPARACRVDEFEERYEDIDLLVIGTPIYSGQIDPKIVQFVQENSFWLKDKNIVLFCLSLDRHDGEAALQRLLSHHQLKIISLKAFGGRLNLKKLKDDDYRRLKVFQDKIGQPLQNVDLFLKEEIIEFALETKRAMERLAKTMPSEELGPYVSDFLKKHNTCTLATAFGKLARATPIEYSYHNGKLYLLSEGGEKFANILLNNRVSVAVYDEYRGMDKLAGMQITGSAIILDPGDPEYRDVLHLKGHNPDRIAAMPFALNMIRIDMEKVEFLCSDFKKIDQEVKQILVF